MKSERQSGQHMRQCFESVQGTIFGGGEDLDNQALSARDRRKGSRNRKPPTPGRDGRK